MAVAIGQSLAFVALLIAWIVVLVRSPAIEDRASGMPHESSRAAPVPDGAWLGDGW